MTSATGSPDACMTEVLAQCSHTEFFTYRSENNACHCVTDCNSPRDNRGLNIYRPSTGQWTSTSMTVGEGKTEVSTIATMPTNAEKIPCASVMAMEVVSPKQRFRFKRTVVADEKGPGRRRTSGYNFHEGGKGGAYYRLPALLDGSGGEGITLDIRSDPGDRGTSLFPATPFMTKANWNGLYPNGIPYAATCAMTCGVGCNAKCGAGCGPCGASGKPAAWTGPLANNAFVESTRHSTFIARVSLRPVHACLCILTISIWQVDAAAMRENDSLDIVTYNKETTALFRGPDAAGNVLEWGTQGQMAVTVWWKPAVESMPCTTEGGLQYAASPPY